MRSPVLRRRPRAHDRPGGRVTCPLPPKWSQPVHHAEGDIPSVPHLEGYIAHLWNSNLPTTYSLIRDLERARIALDTARWRLACDSWRWARRPSVTQYGGEAEYWAVRQWAAAEVFALRGDPLLPPSRALAPRAPGMVA